MNNLLNYAFISINPGEQVDPTVMSEIARLRFQEENEPEENEPEEQNLSEPFNSFEDVLSNLYDNLFFNLSFVLAKDLTTGRYVGFGELFPSSEDDKLATFSSAYVEPAHRRRGIFGKITDIIEDLAIQRGFERIDAFPSLDGGSRRVLERKGYVVVKEDEIGQVDLIKDLKDASRGEGNSSRPESIS